VTAMKRWLVIGLLVLAPVLLPRPPKGGAAALPSEGDLDAEMIAKDVSV
jgi:hypothetical protein